MPLNIKGTNAGGFTVKGTVAGASNVKNYLPSQETGVFLWLRADLGVTYNPTTFKVSKWVNQGTAGGSFDQATAGLQPTWSVNGRAGWPVITWSHTNSTATSSSMRNFTIVNSASDYTFYVACRPTKTNSGDTASNNTGIWILDSYSGSVLSSDRIILTQANYATTAYANPYVSFWNGTAYQPAPINPPPPPTAWIGTTSAQVLTFELKSGGTTNANIYRDGSAISTSLNYNTQRQIKMDAGNGAGMGLGSTGGTSASPGGQFDGDFYEIIGVNNTTAAIRSRIHAYLANRYGITVA